MILYFFSLTISLVILCIFFYSMQSSMDPFYVLLFPLLYAYIVDLRERVIPPWTWMFVIGYRSLFGLTLEHVLWGGTVFLILLTWILLFPGMGGGDVKMLSALAFYYGNVYMLFFMLTMLIALIWGLTSKMIFKKDKHYLIPLAGPMFFSFFSLQMLALL